MNKLIDELELIPPGSRVLCAVSGGADSICLLHALYQLRGRLNFQLAAAHFNHMLRGEESDRDASFVDQFRLLCCRAQRLPDGRELGGVPLYLHAEDVAAEAERRGDGLEETARDMRYAYLRKAAELFQASAIATAHTADDNIETILFHLARGSGLRGLAGIQPKGNGLIRPLLTTTRQEVEEYLSYYGLPHMEDRTNGDDAYARNRIRHQVIPVLEDLYPGFAARTADTAALLRADEELLTAQAEQIAAQAQGGEDQLSIPAALLGSAPPPLAARAARQLIGRLNGGDQDCAAAHLEAVVRLCRGEAPSAQACLPYGLTARREYGVLILSRAPAPAPILETALPLPGELALGDWRIACAAQVYAGQPQGPFAFWLDRAAAPALTARPRRAGDRLKLAGRPEKTVKKWMIDEKIPRLSRDFLPVLDCGGRLAGAAGLGPAEAFLPRPGADAWYITIQAADRGQDAPEGGAGPSKSGKEEMLHDRE